MHSTCSTVPTWTRSFPFMGRRTLWGPYRGTSATASPDPAAPWDLPERYSIRGNSSSGSNYRFKCNFSFHDRATDARELSLVAPVSSFLSDPAPITPAILAVDSWAAAAHVTCGPLRRRSTPCGLTLSCLTTG